MVKSAEVFPLIQYIDDEMIERGWEEQELIDAVGQFDAISLCRCDIINALRPSNGGKELGHAIDWKESDYQMLAKAFGNSVEFWRNMDEAWRTRNAN